MEKCNLCEHKDVYQAENVKEFFSFLVDLLTELHDVSAVVDYDTAHELLKEALVNDFDIGIVDLDHYEYRDYYIVSFTLIDDCYEVNVEKAMGTSGKYLATDGLVFIDYTLEDKCAYINDVNDNEYVQNFDYEFFVIGDMKKEPTLYGYENVFDDGQRFGEINVYSNVSDFIDIISEFFEDYFDMK